MGLSDQYNDKGNDSDSSDALGLDGGQKKGLLDALRVPTIFISTYSLVCAAISIGFIQATLEPHLRQFGLSPVMMGKLAIQIMYHYWTKYSGIQSPTPLTPPQILHSAKVSVRFDYFKKDFTHDKS